MEKRTKEIKIRLTETEHQRLLDRCDRTHLAEWLRQLGLGEHTSRKRRVPDVAPELLRQVSGIGNNLNQIARRLNQTDSLTPSERASLLVVLTSLDRQLGDLLEHNRVRAAGRWITCWEKTGSANRLVCCVAILSTYAS
ncbi:MobC family plasmid mobilization relaxosome protein [Klebsiella pneumoniae]|nr:MobC family plasmid mobilization relaxosome protein [Klebsiella pneumoniae]